jgi:hypothetical protein
MDKELFDELLESIREMHLCRWLSKRVHEIQDATVHAIRMLHGLDGKPIGLWCIHCNCFIGEHSIWCPYEALTRLLLENKSLKTRVERPKKIVWNAIAPYIASENVVYGEDEMAKLCETVLPRMWDALIAEKG